MVECKFQYIYIARSCHHIKVGHAYMRSVLKSRQVGERIGWGNVSPYTLKLPGVWWSALAHLHCKILSAHHGRARQHTLRFEIWLNKRNKAWSCIYSNTLNCCCSSWLCPTSSILTEQQCNVQPFQTSDNSLTIHLTIIDSFLIDSVIATTAMWSWEQLMLRC